MIKALEENFGWGLLASGVLGYFFPALFLWGQEWADEMMILALFFGFLKIDLADLFHLKQNILKMFCFVVGSLFILPSFFWLVTPFLEFEIRQGFFLQLVAPGAVVTPILASFFRLNILWCTVFLVSTSFLFPFTLPLLCGFFFKLELIISRWEMMLFLAKMIFVPALSAFIFRRFLKQQTTKILRISGLLGSGTIMVFLAIIIAKNQSLLAEYLWQSRSLFFLIGLFGLFALRFLLGFILPASSLRERWTNSLMWGNFNNGLMILIAAEFFGPTVLLICLLSEIPWVLAQPTLQSLLKRYYDG